MIRPLEHSCYWAKDLNRARTMLHYLKIIYELEIDEEVFKAAAGLHGAGGYRAQCGSVEGALRCCSLACTGKNWKRGSLSGQDLFWFGRRL